MKKKLITAQIVLSAFLVLALGACNTKKTQENSKTSEVDTIAKDTEKKSPKPKVDQTEVEPIDWNSDVEPTGEQLKTAAINYSFTDNYDMSISINGFGEWYRAGDVNVREIRDVLSGEVRYYNAFKVIYTESTEQSDDNPESGYNSKFESRLYDLNGKMLLDWEDVWYGESIGDWVYENVSDKEKFINPQTKEQLKEVKTIEKIDDNHVLAKEDFTFYILDKNGNIVWDSLELQKNYSREAYVHSCNECVVVEAGKKPANKVYILSPNGTMLGYIPNSDDTFVYGELMLPPYISFKEQVYDVKNGNGGELKPITPAGHSLKYYDGSIAIYVDSDEAGNSTSYLYDTENDKRLSESYQVVNCIDYSFTGQEFKAADYFYACDNERVYMLDRKGNVVKSVAQKNVTQLDVYSYGIYCESDDHNDNYYTKQYDFELNEIDMGKYDRIYPLFENTGMDSAVSDMWIGSYCIGKNDEYYRYDILDSEYKPIFTGASSVGMLQNGRISVALGHNVGAIDVKGNWIIRKDKNEFLNVD